MLGVEDARVREGFLRNGVEIALHQAALAQPRMACPGLCDRVFVKVGVVAALAAAIAAARRAGVCERSYFRFSFGSCGPCARARDFGEQSLEEGGEDPTPPGADQAQRPIK